MDPVIFRPGDVVACGNDRRAEIVHCAGLAADDPDLAEARRLPRDHRMIYLDRKTVIGPTFPSGEAVIELYVSMAEFAALTDEERPIPFVQPWYVLVGKGVEFPDAIRAVWPEAAQ